MKKHALIMAILLCSFASVHADIINGFLQEKQLLENEMRKIRALLTEENSEKAARQFESTIKQLQKKYKLVSKKFSETADFISAFKLIDPALSKKISAVTNSEGTLAHVYVEYVDRNSQEFTDLSERHFLAFSYTSVSPMATNKNVCTSKHGSNTITITIGKGSSEIVALAHEFGHVLYIVPNLSSYAEFLNKFEHKLSKFNHGHSPDDPSYAFVESVENTFRNKHDDYRKKMKLMELIQEGAITRKDTL